MKLITLYIFVEGPDDVRFFDKIVVPLIKENAMSQTFVLSNHLNFLKIKSEGSYRVLTPLKDGIIFLSRT